ncbi:hypothetical protein HY065_01350 [Candidatus Berkelbacteria bacterium]|nr:hypothetical protein [Candidatus Berkelbacteria bacterium]
MKKRLMLILIVILGTVIAFVVHRNRHEITQTLTHSADYLEKPTIVKTETTQNESRATPDAVLIKDVPFTPQAPTGNWDHLHVEACEEAAILMVSRYMSGERGGLMNADEAEAEIQKIVAWENEHFGYFEDSHCARGRAAPPQPVFQTTRPDLP